jgi:AraC-like DNA-binding protein
MKEFTNPQLTINPKRPFILYYCGHEECAPGHFFGPAIRPHYLLHFVRRGRGTYRVGKRIYTVGEGEGFLIYPGVTTFYQADENDPWEYCWIGFDGYDIESMLSNCGLSHNGHLVKDYSHGLLWGEFMTLIDSFHHMQSNDFALLGLLYRCFSHMCPTKELNKTLLHEHYLSKAMDFIHNNYAYDIKITDISEHLSIDRTYLFKLFQRKLGVSPKDYLTKYRINMAQRLLEDSDLSMSEVAYSCGFLDASSFIKHFKRILSITPLQYRRSAPHVKDAILIPKQEPQL